MINPSEKFHTSISAEFLRQARPCNNLQHTNCRITVFRMFNTRCNAKKKQSTWQSTYFSQGEFFPKAHARVLHSIQQSSIAKRGEVSMTRAYQ